MADDTPVVVDVSILPSLLPSVEALLKSGQDFATAWAQFTTHLDGAFGSIRGGWHQLTPAQQQAILQRSPAIVEAFALRDQLRLLLDDVPQVEV